MGKSIILNIISADVDFATCDSMRLAKLFSERQAKLNDLQQHLCHPQEVDILFVKLQDSLKEYLNKIVIEGHFKQFEDDRRMRCTAQMREMFEGYYTYIGNTGSTGVKFLAKETVMREKAKGIGLPNFLSRPVFLSLLQMLVDQITESSLELVFMVWECMENVILQFIDFYCQCYPWKQTAVCSHPRSSSWKDCVILSSMQKISVTAIVAT